MNAVNRKLNVVAKTVATGLLVTLAMGAHAADRSATAGVAWLGQMEVTAPSEVANLGHMEVTATAPTRIADLGSMTVTATRVTAVAQRGRIESTGETDAARARSPRAVLVQ